MRRVLIVILSLVSAAAAGGLDFFGSFSSSSPTWQRWTPVDHDQVSLDCALPLDGPQLEWESPFALYCLQVTDRQPIELWTELKGTEFDPVLYLYCDSFDPADLRSGVIAYDDDDGPGAMAMFGAWDDLTLEPGRLYWLMVAWFESMNWGSYHICGSDNVELCTVPLPAASWGSVKTWYR